jgi:hypothetical protein
MINLHTEFQIKMSMHERDNERKRNDDRMMERGNTTYMYAPTISWRDIKIFLK